MLAHRKDVTSGQQENVHKLFYEIFFNNFFLTD